MKAIAMRSVSLLQSKIGTVCAFRPGSRLVAVTHDCNNLTVIATPPTVFSRTLNLLLSAPVIATIATRDGAMNGPAIMAGIQDPVPFPCVEGAAIVVGTLSVTCGAC
jgi:hypothetical protein